MTAHCIAERGKRQDMFYTYRLVDPRCGTTFYIGKGKGSRRFQHVRQARSGVHSAKCHRIRDILACGEEVAAEIIETYRDEVAAYEAERLLIEKIGLSNLTNVLPGGGGVYEREKAPFAWTIESVNKLGGSLAKSLHALSTGCVAIGGYDITEAVRELIARIITDIGRAAFADALKPHGIEVRYGCA